MSGAAAPVAITLTWSPQETRHLAAALARRCCPGDVVLLVGGLGAGKTTFAQGFGTGLGVRERVVSPTFTVVREYRTAAGEHHTGVPSPLRPDTGEIRTLLHADLHRLEDLDEIEDLALHELVEDAAVVLVEWGERATSVLGPSALVVELSREVPAGARRGEGAETEPGDEARTIVLRARGPAFEGRFEMLAGAVADAGPEDAGRRGARTGRTGGD